MCDRWEKVETIYTKPDNKYLKDEYLKFQEALSEFCDISNFNINNIKINFRALTQIIERVDMRKLYFHIYHKNMKANEYKVIVGLTVFWILKLKPFWVEVTPEMSCKEIEFATNINEKFSLHLVLTLLRRYNENFINRGECLLDSYSRELEYSFRYRDLSKESLFLMFDPFYYMYHFDEAVSPDGKTQM